MRIKASELFERYNQKKKEFDYIVLLIEKRFDDLLSKYLDKVDFHHYDCGDILFKLEYIKKVEDYIESQNKFIQGKLF